MKLLMSLAAGLLVLAPSGCKTAYTVDIRNRTSEPATVRLFHDELLSSDPMLASVWLTPGSRTTLGPVEVKYRATVYVQADARDNPGYPATLHLRPGLTVLNLVQDPDDARSRIAFDIVGTDP